jgi:HD-GYP domain-containing protein (c-di-GMP phosphodiesterase class II)
MVSTFSSNRRSKSELQLAQRLIKVGIALSAERNLDRLLKLIVTEAQDLTRAEGVSLYLRQGDALYFKISQNEVLEAVLRNTDNENLMKYACLPLNDETHKSVVAYVVNTGEMLNIPNVYNLPANAPYTFNEDFDRQTGYLTRSMLTVPIRDLDGQVSGALQLINHRSEATGTKQPFPEMEASVAEALASQAAVAYNNLMLEKKLNNAYRDTIYRLAAAAEYRDPETSHHLTRISHYCKIIARHLGLPPETQELLFDASPMHDIGKLGIPDAILLKPGKLTDEEREIMKGHPAIGADILGHSDSGLMQMGASISLSHHEKFDGSGYPNGLRGENIPIEGRIIALADVFDALASKRVYKEAWPIDKILQTILEDTGSHFDPTVVKAFFDGLKEIMEIYERYQAG